MVPSLIFVHFISYFFVAFLCPQITWTWFFYPHHEQPKKMPRHDGQSILSLLALEILLYFNWWYSILYIFANIIVFAYKGKVCWIEIAFTLWQTTSINVCFQKKGNVKGFLCHSLTHSLLSFSSSICFCPFIQAFTCRILPLRWDGKFLLFSCMPLLKWFDCFKHRKEIKQNKFDHSFGHFSYLFPLSQPMPITLTCKHMSCELISF